MRPSRGYRLEPEVAVEADERTAVDAPPEGHDDGVVERPGGTELDGRQRGRRDRGSAMLGEPRPAPRYQHHPGRLEALGDGDEVLHERHGRTVRTGPRLR